MALETVFLDAGGVLVYPNWDRVCAALRRRGVAVEPSALAAAEPRAKRQLDVQSAVRATNDAGRGWLYFNLILGEAGIPVTESTNAALEDLHAYHMTNNLWEYVPGHVQEVLEALASRGLTLVVVSNANGTLREHLKRLGLSRHFACVLDSCDEGVEKPDPRIFRIALERSGARPETTIHVGDLYEVDVAGARAAGIRPVLLDQAALYPDADCQRVASLSELVTCIDAGTF